MNSDIICTKILIKNQREKQSLLRRQVQHIEDTPKILLGKSENNLQEIWHEELYLKPIAKLRELNSNIRAYCYAEKLIKACERLSKKYGYFIINEHMVFFNAKGDIFCWINPNFFDNQVKIFLPQTVQGQKACMRSVLAYLKLWFKTDYSLLEQATTFQQLSTLYTKLIPKDIYQDSIIEKPQKELHFRQSSSQVRRFNRQQPLDNIRHSTKGQSKPVESFSIKGSYGSKKGAPLLIDNKSQKDLLTIQQCQQRLSAGKQLKSSLSTKRAKNIKYNILSPTNHYIECTNNNQTTLSPQTDKASDKLQMLDKILYEHRSFNTNPILPQQRQTNNFNVRRSDKNYFPNKTTSTSNKIVTYIQSKDSDPNCYGKNKIILQDDAIAQHQRRRLNHEPELDGIGEQLNDLFQSNIENEDQDTEQMRQIELEFQKVLD